MSGRASQRSQGDDAGPASPADTELAALYEASGVVFARVRVRPTPQLVVLTGAVRALADRDRSEILAAPAGLRSLVDPRDLGAYDAAVAADGARDVTVRWLLPGGDERSTHHALVPWLDEHGRKVGFTCIVREAPRPVGVAREAGYFQTMLETINDGILVNDPGGVIEFANSRLAVMLATTPAAMIGRTIFDYMDDESAAAAKANLKRRRAGAEDQFDFRFRRDDGAAFWGIVSAKPLYGPGGEHRGSLVAITDITARRQIEDDLRRVRDELELRVAERTAQLTLEVQERRRAESLALEASRIKSVFLANMSHELRTPLNAILGYTELLAEEREEDSDLRRDLERVHGAASHLLELINNILDLSKIEAAKMEIARDRFEIGQFLDDLQSTILPATIKNGNRLHVHCAAPRREIVSDRTKLMQIALNLLGNAAKFTRCGTIDVHVGFERDEAAEHLVLVVADTGPGIPPHRLDSLFSAFSQADGSIARQYGGTGLGLAICRELCNLLGGDIRVQSVLGEGTAFQVKLPLLS